MATADCRDIIMIAGQDPYRWKGTEQSHVVHVRASGEGGCQDSRITAPGVSTSEAGASEGKMGGGQMGGAMGGQMGGAAKMG